MPQLDVSKQQKNEPKVAYSYKGRTPLARRIGGETVVVL